MTAQRHEVLLEYVLISSLVDMRLLIDQGLDLRLHEPANIGLSAVFDFVIETLVHDVLHLLQVLDLLSGGLLEGGLGLRE